MNIKNYEYILIPNILKDYKCNSCGECCKNKWVIDIDAKTYERTEKKLEEIGENITSYINSHGLEKKYTCKFEKGYCKFITDNKLCRVHKEFGWEYLSDTCKVYPRIMKLTSRGMELSLYFSCPSSAKLLLKKDKFEIIKIKKEDFFFMTPTTINYILPNNKLKTDILNRYFEIEENIYKIFESSETNLSKKIEVLSKFIQKIKAPAEEIQNFKEIINDLFLDKKEYTNDIINGKIIIDLLSCKKESNSKFYSEFSLLLKQTSLNRSINDRDKFRDENIELSTNLINQLRTYWKEEYELIFNNYICSTIFEKIFYKGLEYGLLKMALLVIFLKLRVLLYSNYLGRYLTEDELIFIITKHEEDLKHADLSFWSDYYKKIIEKEIKGIDLESIINLFIKF